MASAPAPHRSTVNDRYAVEITICSNSPGLVKERRGEKISAMYRYMKSEKNHLFLIFATENGAHGGDDDIEHTLSPADTVEALTIVCRQNGGER